MKVFISPQIRRKEFGRKIPAEDLPVIVRSARAALGVNIAARGLPPYTQLIKSYATSKRGPKRIVYLLVVEDGDMFLLFYRGKNDPIGGNVSMANPAFRKNWKSIWHFSKRISLTVKSKNFCQIYRKPAVDAAGSFQ